MQARTPPSKPYPGDLISQKWAVVGPLIPPAWPSGRPRTVDTGEVFNALFYRAREGCTWRALAHDFPPRKTAYNYVAWFDADGTWQKTFDAPAPGARVAADREPKPSPRPWTASQSRRPRAPPAGTPPRGRIVGDRFWPW